MSILTVVSGIRLYSIPETCAPAVNIVHTSLIRVGDDVEKVTDFLRLSLLKYRGEIQFPKMDINLAMYFPFVSPLQLILRFA